MTRILVFFAVVVSLWSSTPSRAQVDDRSSTVDDRSSTLFGELNRPLKTSSMPQWANFLYAEPINIFRIDSALAAYQSAHAPEKNVYTKYYKRWRHLVESYIQQDGSLMTASPDELEAKYRPHKIKMNLPQSMSGWTPISMNTYPPGQDTSCPWQANVYGFAIAPSDPNILVCGTEPGGIFRTADKGLNWTQIGKDYLLQTEAIAIHPRDPNTIYIGTSGAIRKSTDAGATWKSVFTLANVWPYRIVISSSDPNIVIAGTSLGLYRTIDGGTTWNAVLNNSTCELAVHPTDPTIVYAMVMDAAKIHYQFWKSTDAGASFTIKSTGWYADSSTAGGRMTVSLADPQRVYAVLLTPKNPQILRSNDAGESWLIVATGKTDSLALTNGQGYYDLSILASATNADQMIVGTTTAYRTTNGGQSFTILGGYGGAFPIHPDIQDMHALGNDTWISTDGGMTLSSDFFASVNNAHARIRGIDGSDFWGFDAGWNQDIMVGGRYHNGNTAISEKYAGRFMRMGGGEAPTGYVNPMHPNNTYFSDIGAYIIPDTFSSTLSNVAIGKWPNESYYQLECSRMAWDPRCYNTVWIGSKNSLWRSTNGGAAYDSIFGVKDTTAWVEHIEIARSNPDVMYFTVRSNKTYDGWIWKSKDGGVTWDTVSKFPNTSGSERRVMNIAVSGTDENEIWACLKNGGATNKVFHSTDGGTTWENLTTATIASASLSDILHQLGTDGGVYVSASGGQVFYRNHSLSDWQPFYTGLPVAEATRTLKPLYRDGKLRAGSNLGIWESAFYEPSKPIAQPMVDKLTSACSRDTFYFDDYSSLTYAHQLWSWSFPGASYTSFAFARNPKVVYPAPGKYAVFLTVANDYGTSTKTIPNMVTVLPSQCGVDSFANAALDLTPANSSASIASIPAMAGDTAFTISAWIKLAHVQKSFSQIVSNWSSNVGFSFGFAFEGYAANTNLTFYWLKVPYQLTSPFNLDTNVWTNVAITVAPDKVTLYKDGVPWVYPGSFRNFDLASTPFVIGGGLPGQGGRFDGVMDELKFYNRALTAQEIREKMHLIYPAGESGLAAYYQFDENSPSLIYDRTGDMHAANSGGARVASTAPVATGTSARLHVSSAGVKDFTSTGIELRYGANDSLPNDDVVAYRLFTQPDTLPKLTGITKLTSNYWIVRNWGKSAKGNDTLVLSSIGQISGHDSADEAQNFQLFTRGANEFQNKWHVVQSNALQQFATTPATVGFPLIDSGSTYAQFIIGTVGNSPLAVPTHPTGIAEDISAYPNPTDGVITLSLPSGLSERLVAVSVKDILGREVQGWNREYSQIPTAIQTDLSGLPAGCYQILVNNRSTIVIKK